MKLFFEKAIEINSKSLSCEAILQEGRLHLLLGPNGSGKTSFLRYLKSEYNFGSSTVGFCDQEALKAVNQIRVKDCLESLIGLNGIEEENLSHYIKTFSFSSLLEREVNLLSGGENQLLKLIILFSQKRDVYFLDEPLQFLDKGNVEKSVHLIKELSMIKKVFVVEHNWEHFQAFELSILELKESGGGLKIASR